MFHVIFLAALAACLAFGAPGWVLYTTAAAYMLASAIDLFRAVRRYRHHHLVPNTPRTPRG